MKRRNPFVAAEAVVKTLLNGRMHRQQVYALCADHDMSEVDAALRFLVDLSVVSEGHGENDEKVYSLARCEPAYFVRALALFLRPMQAWGETAGYDIGKSLSMACPLARLGPPPGAAGASRAPETAPRPPDAPRANGATQETAPAARPKARRRDEYLRGANLEQPPVVNATGNFCGECGGVLVPNGTCEMCTKCGSTTGCGG